MIGLEFSNDTFIKEGFIIFRIFFPQNVAAALIFAFSVVIKIYEEIYYTTYYYDNII